MLKEPVSPWPHSIGFVLAAIGCVYLVLRFHGDVASLVVMSVYGCGLLIAFGASALYHWLGGAGPRRNAVFRRIDHAAIFALIASTYTPVLYFGLDGAWRIAMLGSVWFLAIVGIVSTVWFINAPRALSTTFYVALGWAAVVPAVKLAVSLPHQASVLFLLGGLLYSFGGAVYATRSLNLVPGRFGFHEVFHVFVIAGAAMHFAAIAFNLGSA
ncbi:MAG: hemolysin III family protein [Candidatus Elarobacter sp.]